MKLFKICLIVLLTLLVAYQFEMNQSAEKNIGNTPIISSNVDEIHIPCQYSEEALLQGLTAYDAEDGYITDNILVGSFSDFTERGVSSLEYAVYDTEGNIATFNRKVVFSDYIPPRITVSEPLVFKPANNTYDIPSLNIEGSDKLDGDISKHILITKTDLDFTKPGKYTASVNLKNSFADEVNMDLPIHILDPNQNGYTIELKEPMIYIGRGDVFTPENHITAIKSEYSGEIIPEKEYTLTINSNVDTSKDGIYEVQFSAISSDKVKGGETWLTVVVGNYGG